MKKYLNASVFIIAIACIRSVLQREWLGDSGKINVKNIPFKETREYVKKVNKAQEKYKELYPSQNKK